VFSLLNLILTFILLVLSILFLWDVFQKKHNILRSYPIVGHLRFIAENAGIYLRRFFYTRDREELPFNRAERNWVYDASNNVEPIIGFGSTRDLKPINTIYFVDAPFPMQSQDAVKTRPVTIGQHCDFPYPILSLTKGYGSQCQ